MLRRGVRILGFAFMLSMTLSRPSAATVAAPPASQARVQAALTNILTLDRPNQTGFATVWDGNKYIQCRRMPDNSLRCEAAGARMQPSLRHALSPERVSQLSAMGWRLDPSFGNYALTFPASLPPSQVAERLLQALVEGYGADLANIEVKTDWIRNQGCPPRNGPSQNLAGMVNDAPAMAARAVHACAYLSSADVAPSITVGSAADLIKLYGTRIAGEIQRLRINGDDRAFVVMDTEVGYVQCESQSPPDAIYCEAESADTWPVLAGVLTPDRVARLHAVGFTDPGRAPNYWKTYPADSFDAAAIASELLTVLHDVYGYNGSAKLKINTEKGPS